MENDVKAQFEAERIKVKEMEERRRIAEEENRLLTTRLALIENSRVYRMSAPARKLKSSLESSWPDLTVEIQYGGQPVYYYILSVE